MGAIGSYKCGKNQISSRLALGSHVGGGEAQIQEFEILRSVGSKEMGPRWMDKGRAMCEV